jgi:hypothetical protein
VHTHAHTLTAHHSQRIILILRASVRRSGHHKEGVVEVRSPLIVFYYITVFLLFAILSSILPSIHQPNRPRERPSLESHGLRNG